LGNQWRRLAIYRFKNSGRVLDLGCGTGEFLSGFDSKRWEMVGVEPNPLGYKIAAKKQGIKIYPKELADCRFPDDYFDLITAWHVLEHLSSPRAGLKEVQRILKKNGLLALETPNIESLPFRVFQKNWFHLDVPRHLSFYSPKTIRRILNKTGFKIIKIDYFSLGFPLSLFSSLSNLLDSCKIEFPLYNLISILVAPFLLFLTIVYRTLPFQNEVMNVYARKK
jgi:ubiquinone/menaquinone biosynthesis C-methylase UbiE